MVLSEEKQREYMKRLLMSRLRLLVNNGFYITEEDLVKDSGTIYSVICARFGGEDRLSDAEMYTGAYEKIAHLPLCKPFLEEQRRRFEKVCQGLRRSGREPGRLSMMETVRLQIEEMISHDSGT